MNIPQRYATELRRRLRAQAVWPPTQAIEPGDYGEFDGGIFTRLGNITTDFGVPYAVESGGHRAEKFQYHGEREQSVGAGVEAAFAGVEAGAQILLASASSFFVSVAEFDIVRLQSQRTVAVRLHEAPGWRFLKYDVVWEMFQGSDLVFYGSETGSAAIKLHGSTPDLALFQSAGKIGASLRFATNSAVGVQFRGSPGQVVGIAVNLFRVKLVGDPLAMSFDDDADPFERIEGYDDGVG